MFARRRQIQIIDYAAPTPPSARNLTTEASGEIPTLKSVSPTYAELTAKAALLRENAEKLHDELTTADAEARTRIESEIAQLAREQQTVNEQLRKEALEASAEICKRVAPHYRALVVKMVAATIELHRANAEYTEFTSRLDRRGIRWSRLKPAFPHFIGGPKDKNSPLAMFLKQMLADGFVEPSELPREFRGGKR